jgi:hypothetical protein
MKCKSMLVLIIPTLPTILSWWFVDPIFLISATSIKHALGTYFSISFAFWSPVNQGTPIYTQIINYSTMASSLLDPIETYITSNSIIHTITIFLFLRRDERIKLNHVTNSSKEQGGQFTLKVVGKNLTRNGKFRLFSSSKFFLRVSY